MIDLIVLDINLIGLGYFWNNSSKKSQITFYLPSISIRMQKIKLIAPATLENSWFKNPEIWLTNNIFDLTQLNISR